MGPYPLGVNNSINPAGWGPGDATLKSCNRNSIALLGKSKNVSVLSGQTIDIVEFGSPTPETTTELSGRGVTCMVGPWNARERPDIPTPPHSEVINDPSGRNPDWVRDFPVGYLAVT
jgi:hypothetical protein